MGSAATQTAKIKASSNAPTSHNTATSGADTQQTGHGVTAGVEHEHQKIALLAYSYWEAREGNNGSPEEDWFRAEAELYGTPSGEGESV